MNGKLGKALTYAAVIIALIVAALGIFLPSPQALDMDIGAQAARVADFIIPTTNPTTTPGVIIDNRSGGSVSLQFRSQLTPVARINRNGGGVFAGGLAVTGASFDVDVTGAASIDADAASNFNVAGAGVDLDIVSEEGSIDIKGDEAAADAVHIDANDAAGTGVTIDVGSTGGLNISGGLTDIGGGTCGTAAGDNDLCVAGDLEVDGNADLDGELDVNSDFLFTANTLNVAAGSVITPGGTETSWVVYALENTHAHGDIETAVVMGTIPANANIIDVVYVVDEVWNDGASAVVDCGISGGDLDAFVDNHNINDGTDVNRTGDNGDMPFPSALIDVGGAAISVICQVDEGNVDASTGIARIWIYYIMQ